MSTQLNAEISAFITEHLRGRGALPPSEAFEALDLFASGALDSLGAMRFAAALEERFNIELTDQDILSDDFRVVGGVIRLVLGAITQRQAPAA